MISRRVVLAAVLAACSSPSGPTQPLVAQTAKLAGDAPDTITVVVTGLRSDAGSVRCFLYDDGTDFPDSAVHVIGKAVALPASRAATCQFVGVGRDHDYAIVMLHDENNDNIFQKGPLGIPQEGYGFSNGARARFSAPSYDDCKVHFTHGNLPLAITAQY